MANICCDDVIFYTEGNPEGLYDLWEDLETYIILNQNPDLCWIGNLFSHKKIDSTGISLRGNVSYMEWNDTYILLSLETAWTPLYEAYQAIAAAYHVPFVMQSIEPGERIYYNTDEAHLFFPDRYCVRLWKDIDLGKEPGPNLYSLSFNHIDGEPSHPIQQEYTFHPAPYQRSSYEFEYRMLSKLQSDCEYYLGYGNRSPSILCNHSVQNHIARMKELWNGFPTDQKPEWLTWEQLLQYEKVMTETGIPVKNCSD